MLCGLSKIGLELARTLLTLCFLHQTSLSTCFGLEETGIQRRGRWSHCSTPLSPRHRLIIKCHSRAGHGCSLRGPEVVGGHRSRLRYFIRNTWLFRNVRHTGHSHLAGGHTFPLTLQYSLALFIYSRVKCSSPLTQQFCS